MRFAFIAAGLLALGCSAVASLLAGGATPVIIGLAAVLAIGSAAVGHALALRHYMLAGIIALGLLAGDAGAMLQTAQRVTAAREAMRAPIVAVAEKRHAALEELARAEATKPAPVDRARLESAERAKLAADAAARDKSAEKGCRENCRLLLQAAVASAEREVEAARAEVSNMEREQSRKIADRISIARDAVAVLPAAQSSTPLADNIGVGEWALDTVEALLFAVAANLPASALIALGVKMCERGSATPSQAPRLDAVTIALDANLAPVAMLPPRDAQSEAETFGLAMLRPAPDARLSPGELRQAYISWCEDEDREPLPMQEIAPALGGLFKRAGIPMIEGLAHGVAVRTDAPVA